MAFLQNQSQRPVQPLAARVGDPAPRIPTMADFIALRATSAHAPVIGPDHVVYAWGSGLRGALGGGVDGVDGSTRTALCRVTVH